MATLVSHQGATAVSIARTLACVSGTDHVGSDLVRGPIRVFALGIGHGINIDLSNKARYKTS